MGACHAWRSRTDHAARTKGGRTRAEGRGGRLRRDLVAVPPDGLDPRLGLDRGHDRPGGVPAQPPRPLRAADDDGRGRRRDRADPGRRERHRHDPSPPGDAGAAGADRRPPRRGAGDHRPRLRRADERDALRARVEEAIGVMKQLWHADRPISFDGDFFQLTDAVLGLDPYEGVDPEIWLGAHGPRMLEICGRLADGWLPTNVTPAVYGEKLSAIRTAAERADRDPAAVTASMLAYVLCAPDEETLERLANQPMTRLLFAAVDLSPETYERHGSTSPFEGGTGFHSFIPTRVSRPEVERVIPHLPAAIVKEGTLHGTPEQIVDQLDEYRREGLDDVILWNITPFADPDLALYSFEAMKQIKALA